MNDSPDLYRMVLDNLYDGVYMLDADRQITFWNKGAERLTGYSADEVLGRHCADNILMHVDCSGICLCRDRCPVAAALADCGTHEAELFLHHKEGHRVPVMVRVSPIRDSAGRAVGAVEVFSPNDAILASRHRIGQLQKALLLDPLTGLGNRRYVEMGLTSRLFECRKFGAPLALIFLDIDHFKRINDTHGHEAGDRVLRMVALTLSGCVQGCNFLGRWGGEEFVLAITEDDPERLRQTAEQLRTLVEQSSLNVAADIIIRPTVSVGATLACQDYTVEALVERADHLMYQSKLGGRNRLTVACGQGQARSGVFF